MIYLIGQLSIWLLLTAAFAGLAGWAFAAQRGEPGERAMRRDRDNLLRDLAKLASGEAAGAGGGVEDEREADASRRLLEIRDGRIAELERALEQTRGRANDAAGEIAELQRRMTQDDEPRSAAAPALVIEDDFSQSDASAPALALNEENALPEWRLRYFEQRVRYLETEARAAIAPQATQDDAGLELRAREAELRAAHPEEELRRLTAAPGEAAEPHSPFAADADVDTLLRWRLLYLERRVEHLQGRALSAPVETPAPSASLPDLDRWQWRARYLEARVRHLEQHRPAAPTAAPALAQAENVSEPREAAPSMAPRGVKPPVLPAARDGAPDDLTLIDGVSLLQQTTLYSLGIFHFDQIAAWTPDNVAWVDHYLRLRGRIDDDEWVEQADDLAREGPAARRVEHDED